MKRLILFYTLALFLLVSCDSPLTNAGGNQQSSSKTAPTLSQIPPGTSSAQADSIRKEDWQQFKAQNGAGWKIRWNKDTGLATSIFAGVTKATYSGKAIPAARSFMDRYGILFGISDMSQLEHTKTQTHRGIRHVTFQQTVEGVPVYEAEYKVHLRSNGQVDMANGTYYPGIDISTSPSIGKSQAVHTAQTDIKMPQGTQLKPTAELVIYPDEEQFRLAWKLVLFSEKPLVDWFYIVDARSEKILAKHNRVTTVTGDGDV